MMLKKISFDQLAKVYKTACMAELQALKPGNVHVFADGHGMTIHDFIKSADVTADVIVRTGLSLGERIFYAVEATRQAVGQNTNLGVLLLCAPLLEAAMRADGTRTLQQNLNETLLQSTVSDAQWVAKAILMANPGGLGSSNAHDVHHAPQVTLLEMMQFAQGFDRIAWQYANAYEDVIGFGVSRYADAMAKWQNPAWAATALYLGLLTRHADTHIARKHGVSIAEDLSKEALAFEAMYWQMDNPKLAQKHLLEWDTSLKARSINPGTSADLTVATLLATYLNQLS